ncbi:GIY-YIG nuclease family protein [Brachybacterium paraconglomeratum]|uniref:GIY-YIG nuclease family protein n=1 Tax=Brachybacterium paraconglomeratum TaxID=173362 RepID=UPI0022E4404B|nr:GIY-YIG nuclease family protein [Brachybacterium paraconglomeratum]
MDRKLCGIYTLEFDDGERYVGQTIDLVSRLSSHRRRWNDIIAVSFVECGAEELNDLERAMISDAERQHVVRNRAFTKMPGGSSELDFVVDVQQQAEWLEGVQPAYPLDERTRAAERRKRTRKKFVELSKHPDYPYALDDLTAYVNAVIPWPSVTGGLYWGVSAVPGTGRTADRRRLLTVNAHKVELFYMLHFPKLDTTESYLSVDSTALERRNCRDLDIERATYRSYKDAASIYVPLGAMAEMLGRESIVVAARKMALGLMSRGPSNFAKFHSDDLLDEVLLHRDEPASA